METIGLIIVGIILLLLVGLLEFALIDLIVVPLILLLAFPVILVMAAFRRGGYFRAVGDYMGRLWRYLRRESFFAILSALARRIGGGGAGIR